MLKYLSALKRKKGFTMVELIVVIAIIAVMAAIGVAALIDYNSSKTIQATANAETFFSSMQLTITRASLTERSLANYAADTVDQTKYIEYKDGVNTTNGKYLFVEARLTEQGIKYLHIANFADKLMEQSEARDMTGLEKYISGLLDTTMIDAYDGYFYAVIDDTFRVDMAHFSNYRLPACAVGGGASYDTKILFDDSIYINGEVVGTCSDVIPAYAFGYTVANKAKYISV